MSELSKVAVTGAAGADRFDIGFELLAARAERLRRGQTQGETVWEQRTASSN